MSDASRIKQIDPTKPPLEPSDVCPPGTIGSPPYCLEPTVRQMGVSMLTDRHGKISSARFISVGSHVAGVAGFFLHIAGAWFDMPPIPDAPGLILALIGGGFATNAAGRLGK